MRFLPAMVAACRSASSPDVLSSVSDGTYSPRVMVRVMVRLRAMVRARVKVRVRV